MPLPKHASRRFLGVFEIRDGKAARICGAFRNILAPGFRHPARWAHLRILAQLLCKLYE